MFEWLLGKKETGIKVVALFDIGSGSVGGALCRLNKTDTPELLFTVREEMPLRMSRRGEDLAKDTALIFKQVLDAVKKAAALYTEKERVTPQKIEHVAMFLASPWSTSTVRTIRLKKDAPFVMSADVLRKMLLEETKVASSHQTEGLAVLERIAVGLKLNGYPVDSISDAQVKEAEVTLATSLAPKAFLALLVEALDVIHIDTRRTFHSFSLPASHILPMILPTIHDALLIDAGAEVTEIVRIKDGIPHEHASAPVGTHMLLRTLQTHGKMTKKESETALKLAQLEGTRLSETHKKAIVGAAKEWSKAVVLAAGALTESNSAPLYAHIFSDAPAMGWLVDALATESYPGQTGPIQNVIPIVVSNFEKTVRLRGAVPDPFLLCELVYTDERFDEDLSVELTSNREPILARVMQTQAGAILNPNATMEEIGSIKVVS